MRNLAYLDAADPRPAYREFIIRNADLSRFVNVVANDFVRGPQQVNVPPGVAPVPVGADIEQAILLITPTPADSEVIARLNVSYLAPQLNGPPTRKDLVNGDIVFTGQREGGAKSP